MTTNNLTATEQGIYEALGSYLATLCDQLGSSDPKQPRRPVGVRVLRGFRADDFGAGSQALVRDMCAVYRGTYNKDVRGIEETWDEPVLFRDFLTKQAQAEATGVYRNETIVSLVHTQDTNRALSFTYSEKHTARRILVLWYLLKRTKHHRGITARSDYLLANNLEVRKAPLVALFADLILNGDVDYLLFETDLPEEPSKSDDSTEDATEVEGDDSDGEQSWGPARIRLWLRTLNDLNDTPASRDRFPTVYLDVKYVSPECDEESLVIEESPAALGIVAINPRAVKVLHSAQSSASRSLPTEEAEHLLRGVYELYYNYLLDESQLPTTTAKWKKKLVEQHDALSAWADAKVRELLGERDTVELLSPEEMLRRVLGR